MFCGVLYTKKLVCGQELGNEAKLITLNNKPRIVVTGFRMILVSLNGPSGY